MDHTAPIKIFVASSSELKKERREIVQIFHNLKKSPTCFNLEAVQWETDMASGSYQRERVQDEINPLLQECQAVFVLFYSKVGQFTLEEYQLACTLKKKVFLYFKKGFRAKNSREIENLKQVFLLKEVLEKENQSLYQEYASLEEFKNKLTQDLMRHFSKDQDSLSERVLAGSRAFYQKLRGPNGRFKHLHISDLILPRAETPWLPTAVYLQGQWGNQNSSVGDVLSVVWNQKVRHAVVVGDGGMGKTVSLLWWWESLLEKKESPAPVPIFIALNELNGCKPDERHHFIRSYLREHYGVTLSSFTELDQWGEKTGIPSCLFLLDGFNEITVEKQELLVELKQLRETCPAIQVVLTSRYDMRETCQWGDWNLVSLCPLTAAQMEGYLPKGTVLQPALRALLGNPMMLTLYAATCEVQKDHQENKRYHFKPQVEAPAELLWNFIEAQVVTLPERLGHNEKEITYYTFLLHFLLPELGLAMEKAGLFDFTMEQMTTVLAEMGKEWPLADFLRMYPEYVEHCQFLPVGGCLDEVAELVRVERIKKGLCLTLSMMVVEGNSYRFLHQHFRDFFAAVAVWNGMVTGRYKKEIPTVLKERCLSFFVRRLVGELAGEFRHVPQRVPGKGWCYSGENHTLLADILALCRGHMGEREHNSVGYAVWNILTIWKEVRGELSGMDLSALDLTQFSFNAVRCSRYGDGFYLAADFNGSRVHEKNLLPQGHTRTIASAVYSSDGKKILSASWDNTIKEWDVATGVCRATLTGHSSGVTSAVYSTDGKKILSASYDGTIKEWDVASETCLTTLTGHSSPVTSAVYSCDGKKILSASDDNTIKEWDVATGVCRATLTGHSSGVTSAVYSADGKKILSASGDHTIKEWDVASGTCLATLTEHSKGVTSAVYSSDGKKILSASYDHTIKEWDVASGTCLATLTGHSSLVTSAVYSSDGKKILSASDDRTIKEWDVASRTCLATLTGHSDYVTSAVYSSDGKKILSASYDGTIKEWDVASGVCRATLTGHSNFVNSTVYSPDEKKILSASDDNTIKEWDVASGSCLATLTGHSSLVTSAVYSSDGKKILSASYDNTIKEWDVASGACLATLTGHSSGVTSAVYSSDGKKILSASGDNTIKEWDVASGVCLRTHNKKDNPSFSDYPQLDSKISLPLFSTSIYIPDPNSKKEEKKLLNIPGLWMQGCSFLNLEKGSQWTEDGWEILKMYGGKIN